MPDKFTVSDALVARLLEWGIKRIYGFPGDGVNGVMGALNRSKDKIEFIQVAHEELAGLAATAHTKFTGDLGVCIATGGPGAIHMLNGLYDAKLDHTPVLAIVGQQALAGVGGSEQQEVDLLPLLKDVSGYVEMVSKPTQLRHVIDRAIRVALGERVPTCIILPHDIQREEYQAPGDEHGMQHSAPGYRAPKVVPCDADLRAAAKILNAGRKVAILAGAGALEATDELIEVAEKLGAGLAKSLLGKAAVPDDQPFVTGSVGWLGTRASNDMMKQCDTLLMVGSAFPYTEFLPKDDQARGVQIDIAPKNLALRYPMELPLVGDSAETLRALLPLLERKKDRAWRTQIERMIRESKEELARKAMAPAPPLNPQLPLYELSRRLPANCIITSDSSSVVVWAARFLELKAGMKWSLSGGLATMGSALPYALAAKFAYPDRVVIATAGDGAMQMSGISGLIDVAKHWKKWSDPRFIVLVLNNRDLNYVTWEQRVMEGEPKFVESQQLPDFPFARYAELLGFKGIKVDAPDQVGRAWDEALKADRPVVIEAWVNADVPTVPPTLKKEQAEKLARALASGDPDADAVRVQLEAQEVEEEPTAV
ncbi:MAG TPA: thiamine pyrophosphate-requiring protein [Gemmatimonadaceae bacterium]|jgi:pyruvate dehydrogenase (quinone)|nr:thiamine pyrophosphate-requiring protein [Gemmatimonadaceae bacterium]